MKKLLAISLALVLLLSYAYVLAEDSNNQLAVDMNFEIADGILLRYNGKDTKVVIPDGVTGIYDDAFPYDESKNITSITLPNSMRPDGISNLAFGGCEKLKEFCAESDNPYYTTLDGILFNKDMTEIIAYPVGLKDTKYTIPYGVTHIRDYCFAFSSKLASVTIPDSVKDIGEWAFAYCLKLKTIELPASLQSIGSIAFCGCDSITEFIVPDNVVSIGEGAFSNCTKLKSIRVSEKNEHYGIIDGALVELNTKKLISFPAADKRTTYVVPDGILSLGIYAFRGCEKLKSVKISQGVTSIGRFAFGDCKNLTDLSMPESLTNIEDFAFYGCAKLQNITIPNGVISIGKNVFSQCKRLKSVTIPSSVTSIGKSDFYKATLYVHADSYAHNFAIENGVSFELQ